MTKNNNEENTISSGVGLHFPSTRPNPVVGICHDVVMAVKQQMQCKYDHKTHGSLELIKINSI